MIIRSRPHGWQLLYILRGSIVPAIAPKVLVADHRDGRGIADPASLLIQPDHYITRLLHAGGVSLAALGVGRRERVADVQQHLVAERHTVTNEVRAIRLPEAQLSEGQEERATGGNVAGDGGGAIY